MVVMSFHALFESMPHGGKQGEISLQLHSVEEFLYILVSVYVMENIWNNINL